MAFKQYTKCVEPSSFIDLSPESWVGKLLIAQGVLVLLGIVALAIAAALTPLSSKPAILVAILLVLEIIAFLTWWLEGRLICLNEAERNCAIIGRVNSHGLASSFKGGDDDYSMNLLLAPGQEHLLAINPKITNIGRGYSTKEKYFTLLHCEFEGDGIYQIREYMYVILALLTLAFYLPWPLDLIVSLLALLIGLLGGIRDFRSPANAPNPGNPLDVNENLGTLSGGDLVVIKGEWIYDSLHAGWHEIHPVRHCEIIVEAETIVVPDGETLDWPHYIVVNPATGQLVDFLDAASVESYRQVWCGLIRDGETAEEGGSRDDPKNAWEIHPLVDGCKPPIIIL
jgi:hypothetical protein